MQPIRKRFIGFGRTFSATGRTRLTIPQDDVAEPRWEPNWADLEDEDEPPIPERLTVAGGIGWWIADAGLFDHDDD